MSEIFDELLKAIGQGVLIILGVWGILVFLTLPSSDMPTTPPPIERDEDA